ncbi:MAG: class I SAM-dependent methyltransferase [Actinomycetota bacterium]
MDEVPKPFDDLAFLSPLSEVRAQELATFLAREGSGDVLDLGCGWAGLLLRALAAGTHLTGLGIDIDAEAIARGRADAERLGLQDRLELRVGDAGDAAPDTAGAVVCIGASQIWGPDAAEGAPLDYRSALVALRSRLEFGSPAVYGEVIWTAPPTPAATRPLGGRADEFLALPALLDVVDECGFVIVRTHQASLDEWDAFESGYLAGPARWLAANGDDHPDAATVRRDLAVHRNGYFRGYRGILGMAYLQLLAV